MSDHPHLRPGDAELTPQVQQHVLAALRQVIAAAEIAGAVWRLTIADGTSPCGELGWRVAEAARVVHATTQVHHPDPLPLYLHTVTHAVHYHGHDPALADQAMAYLDWLYKRTGIHPPSQRLKENKEPQ